MYIKGKKEKILLSQNKMRPLPFVIDSCSRLLYSRYSDGEAAFVSRDTYFALGLVRVESTSMTRSIEQVGKISIFRTRIGIPKTNRILSWTMPAGVLHASCVVWLE